MRARVLVLIWVLVAVGCSQPPRGDEAVRPADTSPPSSTPTTAGSPPSPAPSPSFAPAKVLIDTDEGSVIIDVEKAETPEQRAVGLMHRTELDPDAGMVFLFFEPYSGAFYMKNTLIPLSIAFFTEKGRIIDILDMDPCEKEPCDLYFPKDELGTVPYWGALEVNQGAFEEWGVEVGDRITITQ